MKMICLILLLVSCEAGAQQKQIQSLLQQITANKVYIDYLAKGYKMARNGLQAIRNIKNGDLNLHLGFMDSLKKVNPAIKNYAKVAGIIAFQARIIKNARQTINDIFQTGQFSAEELSYCKIVFDNLLEECLKSMEELIIVISNGKLAMKDDERLQRIDKLYEDMQDKYAFTCSFSQETGVLSLQRLSEKTEINLSLALRKFKP